MSGQAEVSVIIPVYNGERYLAEAIESVLAQRSAPAEIVVVDDGSEDDSAGVAASFGPDVRVVRQDHLGAAAARNRGVAQSEGALLAFLDADDVWLTEKLARQKAVLEAEADVDAVLGQVQNFISPELDESERQRLSAAAETMGELHIGALLVRREAFLRVGVLDTRWRQGEFIDWWGRARDAGLEHLILPELVMRRRLHLNNLTRREAHHRRDYLALLQERLARRRAQADEGEKGKASSSEANG